MTPVTAGPLTGVRVLDVGTRISAPFCAGLLGEQGADVIKVEDPRGGDFMRGIGPYLPTEEDPAYSLWWSVEGRSRRSVTCDLRDERGQALFRQLAATVDVLVENFRPGTMEGWGLGPDALHDQLVYVRISAFGQDGPYRERPGLDRVAIAFSGLLHLTGEPDRPPMRVGVNISDYLTGVFAAQAASAALFDRDRDGGTGRGRVVDAALYGSVMRVMEWTYAGHDRLGIDRGREGNRIATSAPGDAYRTADGRYVSLVAGSDANFRRLSEAMDRTEWLDDPRFTTIAARAEHSDLLNGLVAEWFAARTADEAEAALIAAGVPAGVERTAADVFADEHVAARGDLVEVDDTVAGPVRQQAPYPRFAGEPVTPPRSAPRLGEHNEAVWCGELGLTADDLADLRAAGVV